ncbi:MAG: ROK family protein, partial [Thermoplasmata archaeon]
RGSNGLAGELGHITVSENGPLCNCGNRGCLEAIASGPGIIRRAKEGIEKGIITSLTSRVDNNLDNLTVELIAEEAKKGDKFSYYIINRTGEYIGIAIAAAFFIFLYSVIASFLYIEIGLLNGWYGFTYIDAFVFAFVPGLMHIILDFFTSWSLPILWPFSNKEYKFEIERAVNPITIMFSLPATIFMYKTWPSEIVIKLVVFLLLFYFAFRGLGKLYLIRNNRKEGYKTDAASTNLPYVWYVVYDGSDENKICFSWYKRNLFLNEKYEMRNFSLKKNKKVELPIDTEEKALQYSLNLDEVERYLSKFRYPIGKASYENGIWKVCWSALEMSMSSVSVCVVVMLEKDGRYRTRREMVSGLV